MEFYPADARCPVELRTERALLRPLTPEHVVLDYEAVMSSARQLRDWSQSDWPADDFTLEANRADLERHEREHRERVAFTYTVLSPEGGRCLGCVYVRPLEPPLVREAAKGHAAVAFWVRGSEIDGELDRHLLDALRSWFEREWVFERVVFVVSPRDPRQCEVLRLGGLRESEARLTDGREVRVFGEEIRGG